MVLIGVILSLPRRNSRHYLVAMTELTRWPRLLIAIPLATRSIRNHPIQSHKMKQWFPLKRERRRRSLMTRLLCQPWEASNSSTRWRLPRIRGNESSHTNNAENRLTITRLVHIMRVVSKRSRKGRINRLTMTRACVFGEASDSLVTRYKAYDLFYLPINGIIVSQVPHMRIAHYGAQLCLA